jgi:hypothetical protein
MSAMNHANITQVYEFASEQGTDFVVAEYVQGSRWPTLWDASGSGARNR